MSILNTYQLMWGIEKYVLSGAVAGLTGVAWHDDQNSAYTDGSTIFLPRPDAKWNEEQLLLWRYKAEHELGHEDAINAMPHWKEVMVEKRKDARYKDDGLLWWISNLISDHVQEHNRIGDMVGRDIVLLEGRANFLKNMVFKDVDDKKVFTPEEAMSVGIFVWDTQARMKWNSNIKLPKYPANVAAIAKLVTDKSGVDLLTLKNEAEVFDAAVRVRSLFPEVPKDNNFGGAKPGAEAEESEGKGKKGKGDGDTEGDVKKKAKKVNARAKGFMPNGYHGGEISKVAYSHGKGASGYTPRVPVSLDKSTGRISRGGGGRLSTNVMSMLRRTNLPAKVRAYLMAMKRDKYTTGWRSGRLDTSRLAEVLRGKDDLFRRKEPIRLVDSAVYLLVDSSGSMSGEAFESACAAALMMADALQGIGVNIEIAGFTEFSSRSDGLTHDTWTAFGQRFAKPAVLAKMDNMSGYLSNNADGENILYAYNRLRMQPQQRKILIVLSDGQPSAEGPSGAGMDVGQFTKEVVDTIQADKNVHVVGLGMSGYSPKRFYKNAIKVDSGQPLEPVLLEIVKQAILK